MIHFLYTLIFIKVYKTILKELAEKYDGVEDFINKRIDEICSQEKLSAKDVICFLVGFLQFMFPCWVFSSKIVP